jgi:hypothetical protein
MITLAEASQNAQTALDTNVIDEFRTSPIIELMEFDDAVNPSGGGGTFVYGYRRLLTSGTAQTRAVNSDYTPDNATTKTITTELGILGGSFPVDRAVAKIGNSASGAVAVNMSQKIKATAAKFSDLVINGDKGVDVNGFDGLSHALTDSDNEFKTLSDWTGTMTRDLAYSIITHVDDLLAVLDGPGSALIGNRGTIQLIKAALRYLNQYTERVGSREDIKWATYAGAILVDAGNKPNSNAGVVPVNDPRNLISVNTVDPDAGGPLVPGSTSLYAVRFGLDGFHGVSTAGGSVISQWLPDFSRNEAVQFGAVEMGPVAVALKSQYAAAVSRNIKITA